jgi:hypothetical protein
MLNTEIELVRGKANGGGKKDAQVIINGQSIPLARFLRDFPSADEGYQELAIALGITPEEVIAQLIPVRKPKLAYSKR